jgi:hypothetical protein
MKAKNGMEEKITPRQMVFRILSRFERLFCENLAMKTILMTCPDAHTKEYWQRDVERLLADADLMNRARKQFEPVYEKMSELTDESAVLQLLARIPIGGKAN